MKEISSHNIPFGALFTGWNMADLLDDQIHVWYTRSNSDEKTNDLFKSYLTEDEIKESSFFFDQQVQDRYCVSRGLLRLLINRYTGLEFDRIDITNNDFGKPILKSGAIHFNLSHSGDRIGIAFCKKKEIGLDIEMIRELHDFDQLIHVNFTQEEQKYIAFPTEGFVQKFFQMWTIKESFLKATGTGMRIDPSDISVDFELNVVNVNVINPFTNTKSLPFNLIAIDQNYSSALSYHPNQILSAIYNIN